MVLRKDKLPTLRKISTKPNTSGSGEEGCTSVIIDGEDVAQRWGLGQNLLEKTNYLHYVKFQLNLTHQDQVKKDAPRSSSMVKMWHVDGVWRKTCFKFE
jgi:hypothetical protein